MTLKYFPDKQKLKTLENKRNYLSEDLCITPTNICLDTAELTQDCLQYLFARKYLYR